MEKDCCENVDININDAIEIDQLNDDCFLHIFKFLPVADLLNAERVCRRWRAIIFSLWRSCRRLDVNEKSFCIKPSETVHVIDIGIFIQVLVRCAPHLTELNLSLMSKKGQKISFEPEPQLSPPEIVKFGSLEVEKIKEKTEKVLMQCSNIEELSLDSRVVRFSDVTIVKLLKNNPHIRVLHLDGFNFPDWSTNSQYFANLENLTILNCPSLILYVELDVLCEAKKLERLCLRMNSENKRIKRKSFGSAQKIESWLEQNRELNGEDGENSLSEPELFELQHLRLLSADFLMLRDDDIHKLIRECRNLMAINISHGCFMTDIGLHQIISLLPKLVCLKLVTHMYGRSFTDSAIRCANVNLKVLEIRNNSFTDEGITNFLLEAPSLELLILKKNRSVTRNIIDPLIHVMKSRLDRRNFTPLTIAISGLQLDGSVEQIEKSCPRLKIYTDDDFEIDY